MRLYGGIQSHLRKVIMFLCILFVCLIGGNTTVAHAKNEELLYAKGSLAAQGQQEFSFSINEYSKVKISFTEDIELNNIEINICNTEGKIVKKLKASDTTTKDFVYTAKLHEKGYKLVIKNLGSDKFNYEFSVKASKIVSESDITYTLSKTSGSLYIGETLKLSVITKPETDIKSSSMSWKTDDKTIATVSKDGTVTAKKKGSTYIRVTIGNTSLACKINVKEVTSTSNLIPIYTYFDDGFTDNQGKKHYSATNTVGNQDDDWYSFTLEKRTKIAISLESLSNITTPGNVSLAIMKDSNKISDFYENYSIFFSYKSKTVKYLTLEKGTYYIILGNDLAIGEVENTYKYNLKVYNTTSDATDAKFISDKQTVYIGSPVQLMLTNKFNVAVHSSKIKWTSSNTKVATVGKTGNVTAKGAGECTITATLPSGKKLKSTITVPKPTLDQQLYSSPVYAFVSYVDDASIYNDCSVRVINKSTKSVVYIEYDILQYNSRNQSIKSPYGLYYDDDTLKAGEEEDGIFWVNNDTKKARVCIKNVTYADGKVWNNPYYKTWRNKYAGKSYNVK